MTDSIYRNSHTEYVGVDLFAGAGGMSLGARMAGIDVRLAVENDPHAAATYARNHPNTLLIVDDVTNLGKIDVHKKCNVSVLFGGPPCQGFSTSNQRTRTLTNPSNWLLKEFVRIVRLWNPDWVVFENVRGIIETERGLFRNIVLRELQEAGYTCTCSSGLLCASDFGVPQVRLRFFLIGSRHGVAIDLPKPTTSKPVTVRQAIADLPILSNKYWGMVSHLK